MFKAVIPYESLDPLTIGAADDESKVSRETLELEIPDENLLAAIYPDEPDPVPNATEAAREALESPVSGPRFSELLSSATRVAIVVDNQFRPTPQSKLLPAVLDAVESAGKPAVVAFRIDQPSGEPLTDYRTGSGPHTGVHLIIVRDDLSTIIHHHPKPQAGGTWQAARRTRPTARSPTR